MSDPLYENVETKDPDVVDIDMSEHEYKSCDKLPPTQFDQKEAVSSEKATSPRLAEDGGWGWAVVFGSSICHFFLLGLARTLGIVFIQIQEKFGASAKETALVTSIFVSLRACGGQSTI